MFIRFCCFQDYYSLLCLPETIKSVGMRRQSWSSTFAVFKTIKVLLAVWRQSSLLARRDKLWSSASFRRLQCLATETIIVSFAFQRHASLLASRDKLWLSAPFSKTPMSFDRDYYRLFCLPETIEFVGKRRQIMVIRFYCF